MLEGDESNKAIKAGVWYTVGNILVKGIAFLTIPIFTFLMSTDQYGLYNTYAAYVSIVAVVVSLGLPSSVRIVRYDLPEEENAYHINSALLLVLTFICFLFLAVCLKDILVQIGGLSGVLLLIVIVNSACTAIQSYYNNILSIDFRYREFLAISFCYSAVSVVLSILFICFLFRKQSALGRALGNMVPMVAIAGYALFHILKKDKIRLNKEYIKYGIRFGLPLIPNDLSSLVLTQFDRIMIYRIVGESESGLYSFAYNVAVIYQIISNSIETAWTPWMFSKLNDMAYAEIKKSLKLYLGLLTYGTVLLMLVSPEVIVLLSSEAYWDSRNVVIPIIFAMYFYALAAVPVGIGFFHKKTGWISVCTFCTAIYNIAMNAIFIPSYGYKAAAYTTLVCYFLYAVAHMIVAARLEPISLLKMPFLLLLIAVMMVASAVSTLTITMPAIRWSIAICLMILAGVFAFQNRGRLRQLLSKTVEHRQRL